MSSILNFSGWMRLNEKQKSNFTKTDLILEKDVKIGDNIILTSDDEPKSGKGVYISRSVDKEGKVTVTFKYFTGNRPSTLSFSESGEVNHTIGVIGNVDNRAEYKATPFKAFPRAFYTYLLYSAEGKGIEGIDIDIAKRTLTAIFSTKERLTDDWTIPPSLEINAIKYLEQNLKSNQPSFKVIDSGAKESEAEKKLNNSLIVYLKDQV